MQEPFDGAGRGQVEEDPVFVLLDLRRHFEKHYNEGRGLGGGERRVLQRVRTQGMVEHIRGTGQEEPQRVGEERRCGGAVAVQVAFDGLDIIFAIAAGTVEILIEHRRRGGLQRGDHKAWVIARRHDFGLEHHAPRLGPGRRAIEELLIQAGARRGLVPWACARAVRC